MKKRRKMKFQTMLVLSFILMVLVPLGVFAARSYTTSKNSMVKMAQDNVYQMVIMENEILDAMFAGVKDASLNLQVDKELYMLLNKLNVGNEAELIQANKDIKAILFKYFDSYPKAVSTMLVTDFYTFGNRYEDIILGNSFFNSSIYKSIKRNNGGIEFVPTYNYYKVLGEKNQQEPNQEQDMIFSAVRTVNITFVEDNSVAHKLDKIDPRPVLVVSFRESVYRERFERLNLPPKTKYMVISNNYTVVSDSDKTLNGEVYGEEWVRSLVSGRTGVGRLNIGGQSMVVCYDTSKVTDWTTIILIPEASLIESVLKVIQRDIVLFTLIILVIAAILSLLVTKSVTHSLNIIIQAIKKSGKGDFDAAIKYTAVPEFDYLVEKYNEMNACIKQLIEENYIKTIRQKETEISILTTQLNPHFLHNTLNIINLSNAEQDYDKTSKMIIALSRMLRYTADDRAEMKPLRDDVAWLEQYIYIMKCRYEDKFRINLNISEKIMDLLIPKLFLQPVVENSILHAFNNRESGGVIDITGKITDAQMVFVVEDNGEGMDGDTLEKLYQDESGSIGIKNVKQRLNLIYSSKCSFKVESRPGFGTKTTIAIPAEDL